MDIYNHEAPAFTNWVIANNFLREPFVVVDIGVQGGEHPRWERLGALVHLHGFDAIQEVIDGLKAAHAGRKNRSYYALALGNEDGQREFFVSADTYGSSFFSSDRSQSGKQNGISLGSRTVEIRRLDTLFASGILPPADYIKLDCEGFEPEILRGAKAYLAHSGAVCVTVETNFGVSPVFPRTPFAEINDLLVEHRLLVFDLNAVRAPRASYTAARAAQPWPAPDPMVDVPDLDVGRPGTFDFVFCRDFVHELTSPQSYAIGGPMPPPTTDQLIKAMINFELHGLMDCAVDIAAHFRAKLAERFDVDLAIKLLLRRPPQTRNTAEITSALGMIGVLRQQVGEWQAQTRGSTSQLCDRDARMNDQDARMKDQDARMRDQDARMRDQDTKLRSVRFLAKALARELRARVRQRLGGKQAP